jgi:hypothetical protein
VSLPLGSDPSPTAKARATGASEPTPAPTTAAPSTTTTEASVIGATAIAQPSGDTSIRPFPKIHMPQEAIFSGHRVAAIRRVGLRVEVQGDDIVVTLAGTSYVVTYS